MFLLKDSTIYKRMKSIIGIHKLKNFNHKDVQHMLEIHNNPIKQLDWLFELHRIDKSIETDKNNTKSNKRIFILTVLMFITSILSLIVSLVISFVGIR